MCIRARFNIRETLNIPAGKPDIAEILETTADICRREVRVSDGTAPVSYTHLDVYKRQEYNEGGKVLSEEMTAQIEEALKKLESIAGKTLGDNENPLLVSVRSGARASMPGMMDTVLNPVSYTHLDVYKRQYKRNVGIFFQNYALFPHMTVFDNVAFSLKLKKLPKDKIKKKVEDIFCLLYTSRCV